MVQYSDQVFEPLDFSVGRGPAIGRGARFCTEVLSLHSFSPLSEAMEQIVETGCFLSPSVDAIDGKFCICNLQSISQLDVAGSIAPNKQLQAACGSAQVELPICDLPFFARAKALAHDPAPPT
jgi:hypothetical protein